MESSINHPPDQTNRPIYFDVSPERLNAMSPSELEEDMQKAFNAMTEETYNDEIISAYLDVLDRISPMPEYPDVQSSYAEFQKRVQAMADISGYADSQHYTKMPLRLRKVFRVGLAAAIVVVCLFGSMVVAQAAGLDVFGAIARWTDSVFSFGIIPDEGDASNSAYDLDAGTQTGVQGGTLVVPAEYEELQEALEERNLPLYVPKIPDGFEVADSALYVDPSTQNIDFSICYIQDSDYIGFTLIQNDGISHRLYEKDDGDAELFERNGVFYYIFSNEGPLSVVWSSGVLEYCISTNSTTVDVRELI